MTGWSAACDNDILTGGEGRDTFVFNQGDKHDFITDFSINDDRLLIGGGGTIGKATVFDFNNDGIMDLRIKVFWNGVLGVRPPCLASIRFRGPD